MSLARNASYNVASSLVQIIVLLVSIPVFVGLVGIERYGVVILVWLLFDYLLFFSMGVDRASINAISAHPGSKERRSAILATSALIGAIGGSVGLILTMLFFGPIMMSAFLVPSEIFSELGFSIYAIGAVVPLVILGAIFGAPLHADGRFLEISLVGVATSIASQVLPILAALTFGPTLGVVITAGAFARCIPFIYYLFVAFRSYIVPDAFRANGEIGRSLLSFGLWSSVTNMVSPVMVSLDRVLLGALSGASSVGQYVVPYNLVMRAQILPISLSTVLFPRLSQAGNVETNRGTARDAAISLAIILSIILIVGSTILPPFINLWVPEVAGADTVWIGQLLIIGIWFNGLAIVPFNWLQAQGKPDVVAKVHLAEVVPFVILLYFMITHFGVVGAAIAWSVRATVDSLAMYYLSGFLNAVFGRTMLLLAGVLVVVFLPGTFGWHAVMAVGTCVLVLAGILIWTLRNAPKPLLTLMGNVRPRLWPWGR